MIRRSYTTTPRAVAATGHAPRATTVAQSVHPTKVVTMANLTRHGQLQQASAPTYSRNRTATAQVGASAPLRSAPTDRHASTVLPHAPVSHAGSVTPIVLRGFGSTRGTSRHTIIMPPPQPTVPEYAKRIQS